MALLAKPSRSERQDALARIQSQSAEQLPAGSATETICTLGNLLANLCEEEPDALIAQVRICGGEEAQASPYPNRLSLSAIIPRHAEQSEASHVLEILHPSGSG